MLQVEVRDTDQGGKREVGLTFVDREAEFKSSELVMPGFSVNQRRKELEIFTADDTFFLAIANDALAGVTYERDE